MCFNKILSLSYFGPVQWYAHFATGTAMIEGAGNYTRQSYRNRCVVMGANALLPLSVPVIKGRSHHLPDREARIAWHTAWQRGHWNSLISAYNSSPFFEFYRDDLEPFFTKKFTFLFDMNLHITRLMLELLGIEQELHFTSTFNIYNETAVLDLRDTIHPKNAGMHNDPSFKPENYKQVFDQRHGFVPNLSILDLLFNKGPESILVLKNSIASARRATL